MNKYNGRNVWSGRKKRYRKTYNENNNNNNNMLLKSTERYVIRNGQLRKNMFDIFE